MCQANDRLMVQLATLISSQSKSNRKKVGCILSDKVGKILTQGHNQINSTHRTCCETDDGLTHPAVAHAEEVAVTTAARSGISLNKATAFITIAPCYKCARLLHLAGVDRIVYVEEYSSGNGREYFQDIGVESILEKWNGDDDGEGIVS